MERLILLGRSGLLGSEVLRTLNLEKYEFVAPSSAELDITNRQNVFDFLTKLKPTWIVNCAAWTNVDGAESSLSLAQLLNADATLNLALAANKVESKVIHISTDYVFDGKSAEPYSENSPAHPINRYGETKLQGERLLLQELLNSYVIRTSWLYGIAGKNFVKTMTSRALRNEESKVVDDQFGSPTSARDLAEAILAIIKKEPEAGIYHYSNRGSCSWFELASAIYELMGADIELVQPMSSDSLNLAAKRPKYSLLAKDKWISKGLSRVPEWRSSLELILPEIISEVR